MVPMKFTSFAAQNLSRCSACALLISCLFVGSLAHGAIGILTEFGTAGDGSDFDTSISSSDLVNSGSSSLSSISSTPLNGGSIGFLNDGTENTGYIREVIDPSEFPATIDFNLDLTTSPLGYQITSLSTFSGVGVVFDPGGFSGREHEFAHQSYTVSYSLVGDTAFTEFATITAVAEPTNYSIKVTIVNIESVVPSGVDIVRFQWFDPVPSIASSTQPSQSATAIREIDISGSAVQIPEPNTMILLPLAALILVGYRRKKE